MRSLQSKSTRRAAIPASIHTAPSGYSLQVFITESSIGVLTCNRSPLLARNQLNCRFLFFWNFLFVLRLSLYGALIIHLGSPHTEAFAKQNYKTIDFYDCYKSYMADLSDLKAWEIAAVIALAVCHDTIYVLKK